MHFLTNFKKQIEEDRLARKARMDAEINGEHQKKQAGLAAAKGMKNFKIFEIKILADKLKQEAERLEEIRRQRDTTARIQVDL